MSNKMEDTRVSDYQNIQLIHQHREQPPPYTNNNGMTQSNQFLSSPIVKQPSNYLMSQPQIVYMELNQMPSSIPGPGYYNSVYSALEELRNHDRIIISSPGRVDDGLVQINVQDSNGRKIFSSQSKGTNHLVSDSNQVTQFTQGGIHTVYDRSGLEIMTINQEASSLHVTMQGRAIGSVQSNNTFATSFTASSSLTESSIFQIDADERLRLACFPCCTKASFKIISNRHEMGSMSGGKLFDGGNCMLLTFPSNTNPNAKALLMAGSIMIFIGYFGKTRTGSNGNRGASCCCCCGLS